MSPRPAADPAAPRVVEVSRRGRFWIGEPLFEPGPQLALRRGGRDAGEGRLALVRPDGDGARVLRSLGRPNRARDVVEALLAERGGERGFPAALEAEASAAAGDAVADPDARRDLTSLPTFTVDPASARDFDDAVSARREADGVRLWIHIADVSRHVRPGGGLEAEALRRGTSVYVPGAVEPMLPAALADEACSLAPGVPRLAVTAEIELSDTGEARRAAFYRTVIRSDARLDYDHLDRIFAGREHPDEGVAEPLRLARRAAAALADRRPPASLTVDTAEPEFAFDGPHVAGARSLRQTEAHRLIEHLMILANEQVADLLERRGIPTLYRVHELPDPDRIRLMAEQLESLGIPTPPVPDGLGPSDAGRLAGDASRLVDAEARRRGHGREAYTSLVLRSLKQAYYSDRNLGHAGLGSPAYAHFTSPIRRYPDLVAHRALLAAVGEGEERPDPARVAEAGPHCSAREREAIRTEREADDVCAAFLLERELREAGPESEFEGEVSGLVGAGAFVRFGGELADLYEGFLPARLIRGERFDLDRHGTALVGGRTGRAVRLGDPVTVRVGRIERARGRVDLMPAEDEGQGTGRGGGAGKRGDGDGAGRRSGAGKASGKDGRGGGADQKRRRKGGGAGKGGRRGGVGQKERPKGGGSGKGRGGTGQKERREGGGAGKGRRRRGRGGRRG